MDITVYSLSICSSPTAEKRGQVIIELVAMSTTLDQESAIQQLREIAVKSLPSHLLTDQELKKWLTAKNFNQEKAEKMLKKHSEWRREFDVDNITNWNASEVMQKYYPLGFSGYDKEGVPVCILPYGCTDIRGLLHSCSRQEYIKYSVQVAERTILDIRNRNDDIVNEPYRLTMLVDMEHFSLRHFSWKPALDLMLYLIQMYEANYPNLLKICIIFNAPKIFAAGFAICKPFLQQGTLSRMKIYGKTGWQEAVLKEISSDQLPVHYNGTQTDPDGDPKCSSKICYGGEVPKTFYMKKKLKSQENKNSYKSLILRNGSKKIFEFDVSIPGTELRWEFQSEDFDVGFGICLLTNGNEDVLFPLQKVNSQLVPEEGSIICSDPGTYQVTFENEYSSSRSKTLHYKLELIPPSNEK